MKKSNNSGPQPIFFKTNLVTDDDAKPKAVGKIYDY
jgi:hypothetical protein